MGFLIQGTKGILKKERVRVPAKLLDKGEVIIAVGSHHAPIYITFPHNKVMKNISKKNVKDSAGKGQESIL
jgi:Mg-chelatase subunit ChlI